MMKLFIFSCILFIANAQTDRLPKCECSKDKVQGGSINGEIMCQFPGNNCAKSTNFGDAGCPANAVTCMLELAVETTMRAVPATTRRERGVKTTKMDYPETTRMGRPETTKAKVIETTRMGRTETTKAKVVETTRAAKECSAKPLSPPKDGGKLVPDGELKFFSDIEKVPTECGKPCFGADCYKPVPMECCKRADKSFLKTSDWFAEKTCLEKPLATENGDIMITFTGGCSAEGKFFYGEQCGGSQFGPFKKFADALGLDLPCEQPKEKCECNAYVYTEEAGCFNVGTPPGATERYFMMVNDPVCKRKTAETTDAPVKPTEDPKSCDCGYSKEDFDMLKEMVMKHDKALQEKDMELNDVLSGVTYMRDTMCKMKLPGDMPYESTKKPYESTKKPYYSTKMPYETTRRGYESTRREYPETTRREYPETTRRAYPETTRRDYPETTRKERPETTKMDYPETTKMGRPETTKKDYPETTRPARPESTKYDYESTMERIRTTMDVKPTRPEPTGMPERPETTKMDYPETTGDVIRPTEPWEMFGRLDSEGYKCAHGSARAFKIGFASLAGCLERCAKDSRCNYATTEKKSYCIGCKVLPTVPGEGWFSFETFGPRRQLTQTEALKVEAAALRAELAKVRGF
jgi:hypothetical protein